jgi:hypothetical protein
LAPVLENRDEIGKRPDRTTLDDLSMLQRRAVTPMHSRDMLDLAAMNSAFWPCGTGASFGMRPLLVS